MARIMIDSSLVIVLKNQRSDTYIDPAFAPDIGNQIISMPEEALKIFEVNMQQFPKSYNTYESYAYVLKEKGDYLNSIKFYKKGLEMLKKYPGANDLRAVKKDADQALVYIKEMEEKQYP